MDDVARKSPGDRRDLFTEAAALRGNITAAVIEKDFWVCWTLTHSSWANYQSAIPGTFRLIPDRERFSALAADYRAMQENMIFGEAYGFDELMTILAEIEKKINAAGE